MPEPKRPNRFNIEIPEPLRTRLKAEAERSGLSEAEIIRTALLNHLDEKERSLKSRP